MLKMNYPFFQLATLPRFQALQIEAFLSRSIFEPC
jgi:hypothetical protein